VSDALLASTLAVAVPMWVDQIVREGWDESRRSYEAQLAAQVVAEKGDIILYRSKKKGESAQAFNALARGIAILSFSPGGVVAFGTRYTTKDGRCHTSLP
jgi:hypothetical protein